jgi:hypothetical protein
LVFQRQGATPPASGNPLAAPRTPGNTQIRQPGSQERAGGLDDGTSLGHQWVAALAGKKVTYMSTYSSGISGGYSAKIEVHLCSNGQFLYRDQSPVSVDVPGAFGYSRGNGADTGHWRIITQGNVAGIEFRYDSGKVEQYRLDHQGTQIYADGTRVYITSGEVCN